jgi:hypothetical protein
MANLLDQSLSARGPQGSQGPQSGVDYFGDIGKRSAVRMRAPTSARPPQPTGRAARVNPGAQSALRLDSEAPAGTGVRPVTSAFPQPTGAESRQAIDGLRPGVTPLATPRQVATGLQVAGMVPGLQGLGFAGSLLKGMARDEQSMTATGERDMSGLARAPLGLAGLSPLATEGLVSGVDATRRFADDNPNNNPTFRTYLDPLANAAISQFAPEGVREAMPGINLAMDMAGRPATPDAQGVSVKTQYAIDAERAAAAREAASAAPAPGLPTPPIGAAAQPGMTDPGAGGFDNPSFNPDAPGTVSAMDSVNQFTNSWNNRGQGGGWGGGDTNNSAGGGFGGSSSETRGFAADGGMATDEGFLPPGMPMEAAGPGAGDLMGMGYGGANQMQMGVQQGSGPDERTVQARVQQIMRDPRAVQALVARPMALMQSGELTPDEVMLLGRVAEAAMFNPDLYPQLRQFVAQQGMTPLPPTFDPSVITNIMVIAKTLQAQMPATPAGAVPPTGQAQVEQPVPGFGNGGMIHGPGTGRSDSVGTINESSGAPVKVANEEYIIPAHVVRAKGRDFFDNLLRRYQPVGQGE